MRRSKKTVRISLALAATVPLAACLLDLPTPIVNDDAGFDGSNPDTGLPDGFVPDGPSPDGNTMNDGGLDGMMVVDAGGCDGPCVFATFNVEPRLIDTDNTSVFYAVGSDVMEARNIGTKAITPIIPSGGGDNFTDLKVRNGYVYFTSAGARAARVPSNGGNRQSYTTSGAGLYGIDADNTYAWFNANTGIVRCAINTPFPCTTLGPIHNHANPRHLHVDGTYVYWDNGNNGLYFCSGACPSETNPMQFGVKDLTLDTNNVYWVDGANVFKMPKNTTSQATVADSADGAANGVVIRTDNTHVYWLTKTGGNVGALRRCAIASPCTNNKMAETLASGLANPTSLTLTNTDAFFTTQGDNTIWRVPKN